MGIAVLRITQAHRNDLQPVDDAGFNFSPQGHAHRPDDILYAQAVAGSGFRQHPDAQFGFAGIEAPVDVHQVGDGFQGVGDLLRRLLHQRQVIAEHPHRDRGNLPGEIAVQAVRQHLEELHFQTRFGSFGQLAQIIHHCESRAPAVFFQGDQEIAFVGRQSWMAQAGADA